MSVRAAMPHPVKTMGRAVSVRVGTATAGRRQLPSFILVGAQRAGTTSLFRALMSHPLIHSANYHKGVNYFDVNYHRDFAWYQGHFPTTAGLRRQPSSVPGEPITFEASGYYMFHPCAPARIAEHLPDVKILAMLRDPVERAFSAYKHELARGFETESFERALDLEDERLAGQAERMLADASYQSARPPAPGLRAPRSVRRAAGAPARPLPGRADPRDRERVVLRAARVDVRRRAGLPRPAPGDARPLRPLERPAQLPDDARDARPPRASTSAATTALWPSCLGREPAWLPVTTPPGLPLWSDYTRFVRRHALLIAGFMLAGILIGFVWSLQQPSTYSATASIALTPVPKYVAPSTTDLVAPEVTIDTDAQLLQSPEVLGAVG